MSGMRRRTITILLIALGILGLSAAAVYAATTKHDGPNHHRHAKHHGRHGQHGFPPSVARFDLSGYKIQTKYTLGTNTGNTFEQTYTGDMVQGVPVEGPNVGTTFPAFHYVALPIAHKTLYIAWVKDDGTIVDAFVMNFKTGVVFDYNPTPGHPESSGIVRILEKGANRLP
jgi:hypothetical protein